MCQLPTFVSQLLLQETRLDINQLKSKTDMADVVPFFSDEGDDYHRTQRIRAKKVTSWVLNPNTLPVLLCASFLHAPVERLMPEA